MATATDTIGSMTRRKQSKMPDRHKPSRMIRIPERMAEQAELLAERNATSITEVAKTALREYLEKLGLWPPSSG